jgi:hypothetical protein
MYYKKRVLRTSLSLREEGASIEAGEGYMMMS